MLKNLSEIYPDPNQHRKVFDTRKLSEIANSMRIEGFREAQPIMIDQNNMIIFGECRYRAARMAELSEVHVSQKTVTDEERILLQLSENFNRSNPSPVEEAGGYRDLLKFMDVKGIAQKMGKSPRSIQARLDLLKLDPQYQQMVIDKRLALWQAQAMASANPEKQHGIYHEAFIVGNGKYPTKEKFYALCNRIITPPGVQDELGADLNLKKKGFEKAIDRVTNFVNKQFDSDDLSVLRTAETDTVKIDLLISHLEKVKAAVKPEIPVSICEDIDEDKVKDKIIRYLTGRGVTHIDKIKSGIKESLETTETVLKSIVWQHGIELSGKNFYHLKTEETPEPEAITEKKGNPKIDIDNLKVMPGVRNKISDERKRNKMWNKPFQFIPHIEYQMLFSILSDNDSDFFSDDGKLVTIGITHKDEYVLISVKEQFWEEYGL